MTRTTTTTRAPRMAHGRRGVAMLMVVIALVVTTVLTTAILTSPDRMGPIADNAQASAQARWSATSASNFTVAAIEKEVAATDIGGLFKDRWDIAGGQASSMVTNVTGDLPTAEDRDVLVTVSAVADGVTRTVQRRMLVMPPMEAALATDTRMGELAVFAQDRISARSAKIGVWAKSPEARTGTARVALGNDAAAKSTIVSSSLRGALILEDPIRGEGGIAAATLPEMFEVKEAVVLPIRLPRVRETVPSYRVTEHLDERNPREFATLGASRGTKVVAQPGRYKRLGASDAGELILEAGVYVVDELAAGSGGTVCVVGDVELVVHDACTFTGGSSLVLTDGATLLMWIDGEMDVDASWLGPWEAQNTTMLRTAFDEKGYVPASSLRIRGTSDADIALSGNALVLADLHAPGAPVSITASYLYGRVTASDLTLDEAVILYDPALDSRYGFTNLNGPLYADDGSPINGLPETLESIAGMSPAAANTLMKSVLQTKWSLEAPTLTASGYSAVRSSKVPVEAFSVERERDVTELIAAIKKRYYAGLTTAEEAKRVIAGLELGL